MKFDLLKIVSTIDDMLAVVQKVTAAPGINAIPYVGTANSVTAALRAAIAAGRNIEPFVSAISATFGPDRKVPTTDELQALNARIKELEAKVDEPLPPKEEGEED